MAKCEIEGCDEKHYAKKRCRYHYKMPSQTYNPDAPVKDKPAKKYSYIKPVSDKKAAELAEYRILRDAYFKKVPVCEFPGCHSTEIDLHHKKSRAYYLCDVSIFMSVCRKHHTWIHENDKEARDLGFLLNSI